MALLKIGFLAVVALLSAVAIFLGLVTMATSLKLGSITLGYSIADKDIIETVTRAGDNARFWKLMMAMGFAPALLGAACLWYAVNKLRTLG